MTFKFAVIGDSLAQGFHSGAAGHTGWSFPAILARALGLRVGTDARADFRVPTIPGPGLPIDLVRGLEAIERATGRKVSWWKWIARAAPALACQLWRTEDYYERGRGSQRLRFSGVFHNLGMYGLTTGESHSLTSGICDDLIEADQDSALRNLLGLPSRHRQRAARMVLNPARTPARAGASQLDNLQYLVHGEPALGIEREPLDAVLVWLGSNDCLKTVVQLELRDMPTIGAESDFDRYNLTAKGQFEKDFDAVADRIASILKGRRTRVYVGNVPDITIPPLAKGLGGIVGTTQLYKRYGRFFLDEDDAHWMFKTLSHADALTIQSRIASYNHHIERVCEAHRWVLVDTAKVLQTLAVRRNAGSEANQDLSRARDNLELRRLISQLAERRMRDYCELIKVDSHPLLHLSPVPSVLMLETDGLDQRVAGGLTSIDGVHPSTIGYGIAAEGFLRRMQVDFPSLGHARIPWQDVIRADAVLKRPPTVWDDFLRLLTRLKLPSDWVFRLLPFG